jgi:hypothetical protein
MTVDSIFDDKPKAGRPTHESESGPKRHLVRCNDMSEVEVKADSKANAEFGRD